MMSAGNARQPLLGLGILLLTLIPGYIASRVTGVSGRVTDISENVTDISESTQSSTRIAFYIRTDFHIRVESDIRELQSLAYLVCRLLLEKKKKTKIKDTD